MNSLERRVANVTDKNVRTKTADTTHEHVVEATMNDVSFALL